MHVAIDDFGTGCLSFPDLKHFQVDGMKTGRTFVQGVPAQAKNEGLTRLMITLGSELNIPMVAERATRKSKRASSADTIAVRLRAD